MIHGGVMTYSKTNSAQHCQHKQHPDQHGPLPSFPPVYTAAADSVTSSPDIVVGAADFTGDGGMRTSMSEGLGWGRNGESGQ